MALEGLNISYNHVHVDSASDCSTNRDDSVRGGCAIEIGKDMGSPFVLIRTKSRDDDGHVRRTGTVSLNFTTYIVYIYVCKCVHTRMYAADILSHNVIYV